MYFIFGSIIGTADDEFTAVETYVRSSQYPKGMTKFMTKREKANLRRKCKN